MKLISTEIINQITVIKLTGSITNPIDLDTTRELLNSLSALSASTETKGLILTSGNNKFFSIGFDIPQLLELDRNGFSEFYDKFNELCLALFSLPMLTLSSIPGHCIGAGCILAACTDFRFIARGSTKTGVTATKFGLPVPYLADKIIHNLLGDDHAEELLSTGELYDINWSQAVGYIDKVKSQETLLADAQAFLEFQIIHPDPEFINKKTTKIRSIKQAYLENKYRDKIKFIEKWFSPDVRDSLIKAKNKFVRK